MKRLIFSLIAVAVIILIFVFCVPREHTQTDYAMNTVISVTLRSTSAEETAQKAIAEVKRIDSLMSTTLPESDIYKINSAKAGTYVKVSDETYELIKMSLMVSDKTDGAFDITVNPLSEKWNFTSSNPKIPEKEDIEKLLRLVNYKDVLLNDADKSVCLANDGMSISLGAVAKGYAATRAMEILKQAEVKDAIIDLGGNIYALGDKKIGIQTPFKARGEYFTVCEVTDTSVVTSGAYERYFEENGKIYHHIIDPQTGYPADSDIKSVTVISEDSALADALSTAIFVSGTKRAEDILSGFKDAKAIILTNDGAIEHVGE